MSVRTAKEWAFPHYKGGKVQDPIVLWNLITQVLDRGYLAASDAGIYKDIAPFHCFLHKN